MLWFRNLIFYRLSAEHTINAQALNDALLQRPFVACGAMDMESCGWVAPARHALEEFAFTRQDAVLIALKVESKILPAAAVKDELDIRVQHIEAEEKRKCGRKEIKELKERITDELLPRALTKSSTQRALIDLERGLVIVDAASAAKAEYLLSTLRETLGSLPTRLVDTEISPAMAMTDWLTTEAPDNFSIRQGAELKVPGDEGSIARFKRQVMDCDEVRQHLGVGKIATRLDMAFGERLTFTLTEALEVKSLAMLDVLKDEIKDMDAETQDALFESQMALLIGELRLFIPALLEILGGELEPAAVTEKAENKAMQDEADSFYADAVEFVRKTQRASISAVQRQFRIGYNRAARLIEQMETDGIVSQMESNGSRTVLAPKGGAK